MEEQFFDEDENPQRPPRQMPIQPNALFYLAIGIAIGFTFSVFLSPEFLESFSNPARFDGTITEVNKWVSTDLRVSTVILRINDTNVATCIDGDACLGYQEGDSVQVTCIGIECQATKKR